MHCGLTQTELTAAASEKKNGVLLISETDAGPGEGCYGVLRGAGGVKTKVSARTKTYFLCSGSLVRTFD